MGFPRLTDNCGAPQRTGKILINADRLGTVFSPEITVPFSVFMADNRRAKGSLFEGAVEPHSGETEGVILAQTWENGDSHSRGVAM